MESWRANLIESDDAIGRLLGDARRIAVLGIKPETRRYAPAHFVPRYLQRAGYEIVPVPVYYPDVDEILGEKVYRTVGAVPSPIDIVQVFRRPDDIPPHVPDLVEARPGAVWFQLGIRNDEAAEMIARAGIPVVQDRCMMIEHRRLTDADESPTTPETIDGGS